MALDFIQAKAKYALETNSFMPEMNDQGIVELIDARHPLIDPNQVVPISLMLNKEKKTIMITGPNTGGKTVALKTVGLLSIMAQCGLLVPLKSLSKLSTFSGVYADIGDEQSIIQSLSTFSSHLTKNQKRLSMRLKMVYSSCLMNLAVAQTLKKVVHWPWGF